MSRKAKNRVLMLIENLSFPEDRRMYQEALALKEAGYAVCVICPKGHKNRQAAFEVVDGMRVYRYNLHEACKRSEYLLEYGGAMLSTFFLMLKVLFTEGFDIIHAANPPDLFFALALPFKLLGKRFVFDQHDLGPEVFEAKFDRRGFLYSLLSLLEKSSYRTADLVISTNQSYYEIAHGRGRVPREKLCVVRSGPDLCRFHEVSPKAGLKQGFTYMAVYLGIMGRQDGVDRVIRSAHHLIHAMGRKDVLFVCIGKGECLEEMRCLAHDLGIGDYCFLPGYLPDSEVLEYFSTADVSLAPDPPSALNDLSTMNKILEYMACRRAIVSFDLKETRYSAGDAAVYVKGDDPELFAEAIDRLLKNPETCRRMGSIGYERISGELSWERSKANLIEGYSRLAR